MKGKRSACQRPHLHANFTGTFPLIQTPTHAAFLNHV
jgi:hypothetical protein